MKRVLTFIGGLLAVIFESVFVITMAIGLVVVFFGMLKDKDIEKLTFIMGVIDTILVIISLIFNALVLIMCNSKSDEYKNKQYILIIATALNVALFIFMLCTTAFSKNVFIILLLVVMIISSALYVVDIFVAKNREKKISSK